MASSCKIRTFRT